MYHYACVAILVDVQKYISLCYEGGLGRSGKVVSIKNQEKTKVDK